MPPKLIVEVIGDTSGLDKSLAHASKSAQGFQKGVAKAGRGAVSASVGFHGLGRSVAFASAEFLGAAGLVAGFKSVTEAAKQHQVVEEQLAAAVKASGIAFEAHKSKIDAVIKSQEALGFSEDETTKAFTLALRTTGSITAANRLLATSANIARGSNRDLTTATLLTAKAFEGQTGSLRRIGIFLDKGKKGWDAVSQANQKFAGAAVAHSKTAVGAQERLDVALHTTKVTIGTALLPTITALTTKLADWLGQTKNQKIIQDDVNAVLKVAGQVTHDVKEVTQAMTPVIKGVTKAVGGFKNALELLLVAMAVGKVAKFSQGLTGIGTSAAGAKGSVVGLRGALLRLGALGAVTLAIDLVLNRKGVDKAVTGFLDKHGLPGGTNKLNLQQVASDALKGGTTGALARNLAQQPSVAKQLGKSGNIFDKGFVIHAHTHIDLDGKRVADVVTTHQQKQQRHRATQTSGINAGRGHL